MRALVAICFTLGCYSGSTPVAPVAPVAPKPTPKTVALSDSLGFLPADSSLVVVLELKELRSSAAWRRLEPTIKHRLDSYTQQFTKHCQFDPIASLKRTAMGLKGLSDPKPNGVIVIRGYKRELVMGCVEKARAGDPSAIKIEQGIVTIQTPDSRLVFTFADDTTLVILIGPKADAPALTAAIDAGAPLRLEPRFNEHLAKLDNDPLWFVLDDSKVLANAGMGFSSQLVIGSARIGDGANGHLRMRLADATTASTTATMLQGQAGAAAMFFDELTIAAEDVDLVVRMRMSAEKLESLISLFVGAAGVP
jgi:hypothetical protein